MKRPTIFRTIVLLAGVCTAFWQAPRIIELIDKVRGGMSPAAALAGLSGRGQATQPDEISLDDLRAALSGASANAALPNGKSGGEVVVFSPSGAALTEAQRQALVQKANRLRPSGSGAPTGRVSLPPGASSPPRPPTTVENEDTEPRDADQHREKQPERDGQEGASDEASTSALRDLGEGEELDLLAIGAADDEPVGIHEELRELLNEIAPPNRDAEVRVRRASRIAWRSSSLPRGPRPAFIIGPPGSGAERIDP